MPLRVEQGCNKIHDARIINLRRLVDQIFPDFMMLARKFCLAFLILLLIRLANACPGLIIEPDDGQGLIVRSIQQARSSLAIAMYGFTDHKILQALAKAKRQGKSVRIILQHFPYRTKTENLKALLWFKKYKIPYLVNEQAYAFFHQKTVIIDNKLVLLLTGNFTLAAVTKQRNFGVIITNSQLVQEIVQIFNADWHQHHVTPEQPALVWSPDNSRMKIVNFINSAQHTINIYAAALSDPEILQVLGAAAKRGVIIQILSSSALSAKNQAYLLNSKIKLRVAYNMIIHAKVIIVDEKRVLLGSINFTRNSLDYNRELAIFLDNHDIIQCVQQYFAHDWQQNNH